MQPATRLNDRGLGKTLVSQRAGILIFRQFLGRVI
jgi:hypothetical protein